MWRIEKLELAEVNPSTYGQFYGGDCYLVLYTYQISNQQQYILYMWQVSIITTAFRLLFCLNTHSVSVTTKRTGSLRWQDFMSYTRVVMPLKMRSQLLPTRLSILITNTMEPRCRSGWSWERSLAISWQFLKANSSSLRYSMTFSQRLLFALLKMLMI